MKGQKRPCKKKKERRSSDLTLEGFLSRVLQRVNLQGHAALERLPARFAGERHVLRMG